MRLPVDPDTALWRGLRDGVRRRRPAGRIAIAVIGEPVSAAWLADGIAAAFSEQDVVAVRTGSERFLRPRDERADGRHDLFALRRVLLDPFREGPATSASIGFQLAVSDPVRDEPAESEWVTAPRDAVLVVDGGEELVQFPLAGAWDLEVRADAHVRRAEDGAVHAARDAR